MKINRFIALVAIALLVVGAMGLLSYKALAQTNQPATATDCNGQDDDAAEAAETGPDTDDIEEQCGPQDEDVDEAGDADTDEVENEVEEADGVEDANEASEAKGVDEADEVAPTGLSVTAEEAQAIVDAANPGTATLNVEFDRENGTDIWEVALDNGLDVKVDASSGVILLTENRD
jgi:hypothetical protein